MVVRARTLLAGLVAAIALVPITSQAATDTLPFDLVDNRILVQARINGAGPFTFILDTGAYTIVVTPQVAQSLHLPTQDAGRVNGVGNHAAAIRSTQLASLRIGARTFAREPALVADLSQLKSNIGFARLDGIIGYSVMQRYDVLVDMDHDKVILSSDPVTVPSTAHRLPLSVGRDHFVRTPVTIAGDPGMAVLDTGDRSSLSLFNGFARQYGFYKRFPAQRNILTGFGLGGGVYADVFRTPNVSVFGYTLHGIVTRASRQSGGAFASMAGAGNIGTGVLKRFNVLFGYRSRRLIVWPSRFFSAQDPYDRAGLWISQSATGLLVAALTPGGPAAHAGIHLGDRVVAVDGRSIQTWSVPQLRAFLATQPAGTRVSFTVRKAQASTVRTVVLRNLI